MMSKEALKERAEKLKQEFSLDIINNMDKVREYQYLLKLIRMPVELNEEVQQIHKCEFGFIKEGKRFFLKFIRTGGTPISTWYRVKTYKENKAIEGNIQITVNHEDELKHLAEYGGEMKAFISTVKSIIENYKYKGLDEGWCKK